MFKNNLRRKIAIFSLLALLGVASYKGFIAKKSPESKRKIVEASIAKGKEAKSEELIRRAISKISEEKLMWYNKIAEETIAESRQSNSYAIIIDKLNHTLYLFYSGELKKTYKAAFGLNPIDDKRLSGDFCTPEGKYYIYQKNPNSYFHKSLLISYPNIEDAKRGLEDRIINESVYRQIVDAVKNKKMPPQHTRLGNEIRIHGGGNFSDWTSGCIALTNKEIDELYSLSKLGTPVTIARYLGNLEGKLEE